MSELTGAGMIVGAYPVYLGSADDAAVVVEALAPRADVSGFELPYAPAGTFVPAGCPDHWRHVVTCIGNTMARLHDDPMAGLASPDPEARRASVRVLADVRDQVARLEGRVRAVEVHSAPTRFASPVAFADSLAELADWDWLGAELLIEHCDQWRDDHAVEKGFLSAADELEVAAGLGGRVRFSVNWARSVIETREVGVAAEQVAAAARAGLLGGVIFSSVADSDTLYGPAWIDAHLPPFGTGGSVPSSLLTADLVRETLAAAGDALADAIVGLKIGIQPLAAPIEVRVEQLLEVVELVSRARADIGGYG